MPPAPRRRGWVRNTNSLLQRGTPSPMRVLDLFCGAGGFSLGFWANGFDVFGIDRNADSARTYALNFLQASCADLNELQEFPEAEVLIAGPPCQPWSRAGKRHGENDERDGLLTTARIVDQIRPAVAIIENVPDIARPGRRQFLDDFKDRLALLGYSIAEYELNAADYGVPQNRRRVFLTATSDRIHLHPPEPVPGIVSVRQAIPGRCQRLALRSKLVSDSMVSYIERYERASGCRTPRDVHLDRPSRTLTVRNLSGATGDMLRLLLPDGRRRTLTIEEAARLQSFPDWFKFHGSERSKFEQIGNAVPPLLSLAIADTVKEHLERRGAWSQALAYPRPSSESASATMRANRRRDTTPELLLRSALHHKGWRFRVDLSVEASGRKTRPDIVFTRKRVAVFVDGCFWHSCHQHGTTPKSNVSYWQPKLQRNIERDTADTEALRKAGWSVVRVWEHESVSDSVAAVEQALKLST